jgi:hypothetical protein
MLVRVASPETESQVALIVSALNAAGIPHFIQGGGLGAVMPGLQINALNSRSVMVPAEDAADAVELLRELDLMQAPSVPAPLSSKLRMVLEVFFLGWMVPGSKRRSDTSADEA